MALASKPRLLRNHVVITPESSGETILDIEQSVIEDLYKRYGAILFRGFDLDTDAFRALTRKYCTHAVMNESGGRGLVDKGDGIQTVNTGIRPFPLHPELSREPWKPDVCWFGCLVPPRKGSETTICDGTTIVRRMPKAIFNAFNDRRLLYRRRATPTELEYWLGSEDVTDEDLEKPPPDCPFSFESTDGAVFRSFTAPALHKTMFSDELCWGNFLLFARYHNGASRYPVFADGSIVAGKLLAKIRRIGNRHSVPIKWQKNDLLMLDNSRFMHGRKAIKDVENRHILTYFGFLRFAVPSPEEGPNPRWRNPDRWRNVLMDAET